MKKVTGYTGYITNEGQLAPVNHIINLKMPPAALGQGLIRYETLAGEDYQVCPCIMLVEGVHRGVGSDPVYYPPQSLAESAPMWNNVPVTVGHPVNRQGEHILCNTDGTIRQQWQIGHVSNARIEEDKLKADIWINVKKANDKAKDLLPYIQNGGELQVSTGMLAGLDGSEGIWNSEDYVGSIVAIIPDHLALLPGGTGACSWDDGCGVRFNQELKKEAPAIFIMSQDLQATMDAVNRYVDSMDEMSPDGERYSKINFVRAIFDNYFVYQQRELKVDGAEETRLYKQPYSMTDGLLETDGEPIEVMEEVKYKPVANDGTSIQNSEGGKNMGDKKESKCCPEKVEALIANEATAWTGDDREWLESLNEDQVDKMETTIQANEPEADPEVDPDPTPEEVTLASYLSSAPVEIRAVLNEGMKAMDEKRQGLMAQIQNHDGNSFTEDQLKGMDTEMLEGISSMIPVKPKQDPANFLGANPQNNPVVNEGEEEEAYIPVTLAEAFVKKD